jgi:hypothetical protein
MNRHQMLVTALASGGAADTTAPTVASFTVATPSASLDIPIAAFTASEPGAYFLITENSTPPAVGAAGWNLTAPTIYTVAAQGAYTLYPWVKDGAGNISSVYGSPASVNVVILTLRDEFTTNASAPLTSPRSCEPGPGTLTIVDTGNKLSIASNKLTGGGVQGNGDPRFYGAGVTRVAGRFLTALLTPGNTDLSLVFGFSDSSSGVATGAILYFKRTATIKFLLPAEETIGAYASATAYQVGVSLRTAGALFFIKGGAFTEWTLLWVDNTLNAVTTYPEAGLLAGGGTQGVFTLDGLRMRDLPAPFDTDYGPATQQLAGARSAGDAFSHEANCFIKFVCTTRPSAGNVDLRFRQQDATNYWQITVDSAGALVLNEVVAGTPTQRATAAAGINNGHIITIIAEGSTIRGLSGGSGSPILRWTYASATNFATATSGVLSDVGTGGSISDIVSWPRTMSGTALSVLNATVNP